MQCPKCNVDLEISDQSEYGFEIIDVCPECDGAWFDAGELNSLDDSVWINFEHIEFEKLNREHQNLQCPICDQNLETLSPKETKELIVDRCVSCKGFWLDKGELDLVRDVALELHIKLAEELHPLDKQSPERPENSRVTVGLFVKALFGGGEE